MDKRDKFACQIQEGVEERLLTIKELFSEKAIKDLKCTLTCFKEECMKEFFLMLIHRLSVFFI